LVHLTGVAGLDTLEELEFRLRHLARRDGLGDDVIDATHRIGLNPPVLAQRYQVFQLLRAAHSGVAVCRTRDAWQRLLNYHERHAVTEREPHAIEVALDAAARHPI